VDTLAALLELDAAVGQMDDSGDEDGDTAGRPAGYDSSDASDDVGGRRAAPSMADLKRMSFHASFSKRRQSADLTAAAAEPAVAAGGGARRGRRRSSILHDVARVAVLVARPAKLTRRWSDVPARAEKEAPVLRRSHSASQVRGRVACEEHDAFLETLERRRCMPRTAERQRLFVDHRHGRRDKLCFSALVAAAGALLRAPGWTL
jgi:hypothetical protein